MFNIFSLINNNNTARDWSLHWYLFRHMQTLECIISYPVAIYCFIAVSKFHTHKPLFECMQRKRPFDSLVNHIIIVHFVLFLISLLRGRFFKAGYSVTDHYVKNTKKWKMLQS